jgi:prefoldin subunit 5
MATPEHSTNGQRLQRAALAEGTRLARSLRKTEHRIAALRTELEQAEAAKSELQDRISLLSRLTGQEIPFEQHLELLPRSPSDGFEEEPAPRSTLRGAAIRSVAVRLLAIREDPLAPIHHASWFSLVRQAGYEVGGRDPGATFLTQISRSPVVARGSKPGVYQLDLEAPQRLEVHLNQLRKELSALHQGQQTIEAISSTRERRDNVGSDLARVERLLLEAVESLGLNEDGTDDGGPGKTAGPS